MVSLRSVFFKLFTCVSPLIPRPHSILLRSVCVLWFLARFVFLPPPRKGWVLPGTRRNSRPAWRRTNSQQWSLMATSPQSTWSPQKYAVVHETKRNMNIVKNGSRLAVPQASVPPAVIGCSMQHLWKTLQQILA